MKQALNILRHPIDGVWDMKREQTGRYRDGFILILLTILAVIFNRQMRAFVFNNQYNVPLEIIKEVAIVVLPVFLFVLANYAVTTLLDGKGTFKEIFLVTCHSLMPLIIFFVVTPILSHLLSLNELVYLTIIDAFGYAWMLLMLYLGIKEIHEYSASKMVSTLVLTVIGAAIIVFIVLLFSMLLSKLVSLVTNIVTELQFRM